MSAARRGRVTAILAAPFEDLAAVLERHVLGRGVTGVGALLLGAAVCWWVYVPIHELLHVAGCLLAGGTVAELEIAPLYGGAVYARMFDVVTAGGDYAGRLSGFEPGSDLGYFVTVFAPYVLSVFVGVPWLRHAGRGGPTLLAGAALIVALAPLTNVIGDGYEMGSILVTAAVGLAGSTAPWLEALRADDVLLLVDRLAGGELGVPADDVGAAWTIVVLSCVMSVVLAFLTYALGARFADALGLRAVPPPAQPSSSSPR